MPPIKQIVFIVLLAYATPLSGQTNPGTVKLPIDTGMLNTWPRLNYDVQLSRDGHYVAYSSCTLKPVTTQTLFIRATNGSWQKEWCCNSAGEFYFTPDSKKLFRKTGDSIWLLDITNDHLLLQEAVKAVNAPFYKKGEWIAYTPKGSADKLVLLSLVTGEEQHWKDVKSYAFSNQGRSLLLNLANEQGGTTLRWFDTNTEDLITIWSGNTIQQPNAWYFDKEGRQLSFLVSETNNKAVINTVWYYKQGMDKAVLRVNDQSPGIREGFRIAGSSGFTGNGNWLLFTLINKETAELRSDPDIVKVDIWNYQDKELYPVQRRNRVSFWDLMSVDGGKVICPEEERDWIGATFYTALPGDYALYMNDSASRPDDPVTTWWLVSFKTGARTLLWGPTRSFLPSWFSPHGQWLVYWNSDRKSFYSYELATGKTHDLTTRTGANFTDDYPDGIDVQQAADIAGWTADQQVLLYDRYDLWSMDLTGKIAPVNVTNGYGRKQGIKLRLVYEKDETGQYTTHHTGDTLLLTGFNERTKYNGFYRKRLLTTGDPEVLTAGPFTYYRVSSQKPHEYAFSNGMQPVQAGNAGPWIVRRESATDYPNFYYTRDLKTFTPLTSLQPQSQFQWLTTELIMYTLPDGKPCQVILYKPENLDPNKKYPVIFTYYEQLSHRLYEFPQPGLTGADINIPWFVSRGYLVCTPDIHYTIAASRGGMITGESALQSVEAAAKWLSKLPFVDKTKMGLQGHSFGGGETAYIITHSKLFVAACEMAGLTDYISLYLTLGGYPEENISLQEYPQLRMGATLWERPDLYIKSSAVLSADKTAAPLLIVHNKKDGSVNFRQGMEMYLALRRLGKPCWLLQYDESNHLIGGKEGLDYTLRLTQFFDHYLMGKPAPKWMTTGNRALLR